MKTFSDFLFKSTGRKIDNKIPVNRGEAGKNTESIANMYDDNNSLFITITPEGTRTLVKKWKLDFYKIAVDVIVPIINRVLDYKIKTGGMKGLFYPAGDVKKDIKEIQSFYKGIKGKNPELSKIFD